MEEGYAMIAGGMSMDGWLQFTGVALADGGFIRQELEKILDRKKTK